MDDNLVQDRVRPSGGIQALLNARAPSPPERGEPTDGEAETLPDGSGEYRACARVANKMLPAVHFLLKDRSIWTSQYCHLDSNARYLPMDESGKGSSISLRFTGTVITDVKIEGRNLRLLYDHLTHHRMPWIAELPDERDFEEDRAMVINRILIQPVGVGG